MECANHEMRCVAAVVAFPSSSRASVALTCVRNACQRCGVAHFTSARFMRRPACGGRAWSAQTMNCAAPWQTH
eukprot:2123825-Lingulodinium_polyedra.AAC.1